MANRTIAIEINKKEDESRVLVPHLRKEVAVNDCRHVENVVVL